MYETCSLWSGFWEERWLNFSCLFFFLRGTRCVADLQELAKMLKVDAGDLLDCRLAKSPKLVACPKGFSLLFF